MESAYQRKKDPEQVRQRLLACGTNLCVESGIGGLSLQDVATAAGVTKGGLLHHFPTKQHLVDAIFDALLSTFATSVARALEVDREAYGRFTRAYLVATLDWVESQDSVRSSALWMASLTDARSKLRWGEWITSQLRTHRRTDAAVSLAIVRHAVDGIWFSALAGQRPASPRSLRQRLLQMTRKP